MRKFSLPQCNDPDVEELEDGWHSAGDVIWKDFEHEGEQYSIAGGPRGVFLWSQGNGGIDVATVVVDIIWSVLATAVSRTNVVKVRRRRWGPIRTQVLRREFPASKDLLDCVQTVERRVRDGAA
jgi:hypothetical protein